MQTSRLIEGLKSIRRAPELLSCLRGSPQWLPLIMGYVRCRELSYPFRLHTRSGDRIEINDWADLTTVWAVLFGDEYRVASTDKVVVDLGANIGAFTLLAARRAPHAKIVSLEPFPANFERLVRCVSENGLAERVRSRSWAIAAHEGAVCMDAAHQIPSHSRRLVAVDRAQSPVWVEGCSLQRLFETEQLDEIDYLKIDIEGGEYELIHKTPRETLRRCRVIGLECHVEGDCDQLMQDFYTAGFRRRRMVNRVNWITAEMERV